MKRTVAYGARRFRHVGQTRVFNPTIKMRRVAIGFGGSA
jgi:hypothetical protein